jgi:RNA polymerase sigma factor (sigma-70 family)
MEGESYNVEIHRDVIEASRLGQRAAQFKLYNLYSRSMFNVCLRLMNQREEAEDILQEAFTEAFRRLDSFRFESTFGAWLKQIVVNRCINTMRKRRATLLLTDEIEQYDDRPMEEDIAGGLQVEEVRAAMAKLPEGGRVVFSLYLLEGYDHSEIAQIMGISESTSKTQYMRAKNRIRSIIEESRRYGQA